MVRSARNIAAESGATLFGPAEATFDHFAFDSRRISGRGSTCFLALTSATADGHSYIPEAIEKGASVVVGCQFHSLPTQYPHIAFLQHEQPLEVLRAWARAKRATLSGPVLGITGSNGKTVVKEWTFELLGGPSDVHRTPASFNSAIGVPLTLAGIQGEHTAALIEVGIDRPGTMSPQAALVQPTVGVFTTLGDAHGEHFDSDDEKFIEKWQLFSSCERVAASRVWIDKATELGLHVPNPLVWGPGEALDPAHLPELPFSGGHHLENALSAAAGAMLMGASLDQVRARLTKLEPLEMRMQLRAARDGGYLLEDTYSSDLESLRWALDELSTAAPSPRRWAVLSALSTPEATAEARELALKYELDRIWWVNAPSDVSDLVAEFAALDLSKTTVLIKGQRRFGLERFAATLQDQYHSTWAEVNLSAMRRNLQKFKEVLDPQTGIMAMVKAASYGAGTLEVARWLQELHVDFLGVAFAQEALSLRAQGITMPILVLNVDAQQIPMLAAADCDVELFSLDQLRVWNAVPGSATLRVHLKVNTGMNRLGFSPESVPAAVASIGSMKHVEVAGVFSHLAAADAPEHDAFTKDQFSHFEQAVQAVRGSFPRAVAHVLNTHGIHRFSEHQHEMVRLGIGLYGVGSYQGIAPLEEVIQWKCRVSQVGAVKAGQSVGYGRGFTAQESTTYATLPVGYADGLSRALSGGKGSVFIGGHQCPILGNVCMDMVMVDTSGIHVQAGDEVELLGPNQSATDLARAAGTIGYEILTGIGRRVPRLYLKD